MRSTLKDYITGGTVCIRPSVREFGVVHRVQKGLVEDMFIQDNYYLCRVKEGQGSQSLDDYEAEEGFTLEYVSPDQAIKVNRTHSHNGLNINGLTMIDRDSRVLEMIRVSAAE